ncbi:DNA-binding protein [Bacteroides gallinaceum]|uniref:HU family DNA-binding protein n=1 Tax=Bacteroides gallinaceum TaxID=1462571 RepID=UPI0025AAFA50|nr:DNA-binding protein [Bacteroides gallinaceum]MDN0067824.1 DNA-binding protein [Bacteroides gallinaceum]
MRNETGKGKTILSLTRLSVKNYLSDNLPADTHAVLRALPNIMADFMKESRVVHFEGLGWFRYTTVSAGNGVATKEEVSSDQITGLRVQFTPDRTRNMSGGYTRALVADEGITFMEWLGKESDETQVPDNEEENEDGGL